MAEVEREAGGEGNSDGGGKSVSTWAGGIPVSTSFPWICGLPRLWFFGVCIFFYLLLVMGFGVRVRVRARVTRWDSGASNKTGAIPILVLPSFRCDAAAREEEKQQCRRKPPGNSHIHCRTVCSTPCPEPATVLLRSLRCRGVFVPVRAMGLLPPTDVRVSAINAPFRTAGDA